MPEFLATVAIGFASGVLSGMFGIGGGVITTPAIRLLLGAPALVAVGTPLVALIPSVVTGAISYARARVCDLRGGVTLGLAGALTAVVGAWLTRLVGGTFVLVATAVLILVMAADMARQVLRPPQPAREVGDAAAEDASGPAPEPQRGQLVGAGAATGLYSGFLGLGGGFVLVPLLTRWLRYPMKRAIGTSLVAIAILAVPGAITHAVIGNVDWAIAAGLTIGAIPGAVVGSRIGLGASDRALRLGFAIPAGPDRALARCERARARAVMNRWRPARAEEVARLWPAARALRAARTFEQLQAEWSRAPWALRVSDAGDALLLRRWRAESDALAIRAVWAPPARLGGALVEALETAPRARLRPRALSARSRARARRVPGVRDGGRRVRRRAAGQCRSIGRRRRLARAA